MPAQTLVLARAVAVLLAVEAVVWLGVGVGLAAQPVRWTGDATTGLVLAGMLGAAAVAFAVAAVGATRRPPRLVLLSLVLAAGTAVTSLTDEVGGWDVVALAANLVLVGLCVALWVALRRQGAGARHSTTSVSSK